MPDVAALTADHFRPLLNQAFTIERGPDDAVVAELVEIEESTRRRPEATRLPFVLTLQTREPPVPGQGTYALVHPALGRIALFMTAVLPTPLGQRYEIVFA